MSVRANKLILEKSPYLLQHAHNPVDWLPWGEDAFKLAREQNKPIFLSIGYFSCHWCHVFEKESFENDDTAKIMNEHFINIKVDREERPDIDNFYMTFVQATTGGGGWPLSVWLTPDLKPFLGGTYFPPEDTRASPGFQTILTVVYEKWQNEREKLLKSADSVVDAIRRFSQTKVDKSNQISPVLPLKCLQDLQSSFDEQHPGFTWSPKFPNVSILNFLNRFHSLESTPDRVNVEDLPIAGLKSHLTSLGIEFPDEADQKTLLENYHQFELNRTKNSHLALDMLTKVLNAMARGGIHDHVSQGFHRYSVDREWHVPHFEKMLYDQAQLIVAYSEAYQTTKNPYFAEITEDVITYVCRDLSDPLGGFYCAEDADSKETETSHETKEGAFCVWTYNEIKETLQEDSELFSYHFGVQEDGNVPKSTDIQGELKGKNVLIQRYEISETADKFMIDEKSCSQKLQNSLKKLFGVRSHRPKPNLDDKIVVSWNSLMISALSKAHQILGKTEYLERATKVANFIHEHLYKKETKSLLRCYRKGPSNIEGFLDDYAFLIQGLLDLYESDFDAKWLRWAVDLQAKQDELFLDDENGGYFGSSSQDQSILIRLKEASDNAEPSANSVSALNLLRLSSFIGDMSLKEKSLHCLLAFEKNLTQNPTGFCYMTSVFHIYQASIRQIVLVGSKNKDDFLKPLLNAVYGKHLPNRVLIAVEENQREEIFLENVAVKDAKMIANKPTIYVCHNFVCQRPVNDPSNLVL